MVRHLERWYSRTLVIGSMILAIRYHEVCR
jgi:hypothetical protein